MILTKEEAESIEHRLLQIADYLGLYQTQECTKELAIYSLGRIDEMVQNAEIKGDNND